MRAWSSFVALGDSLTEGLDDFRPNGTPRGWADRVAEQLAGRYPGLRYANLAVRGSVLDQIVAEQIPLAERLRPDLISFFAGGNDILALSCDVDDLARRFHAALDRLTATGATVLTFTGFDLGRMPPPIRWLRGRVACLNELIRAGAQQHGSIVVDLWGMAPLTDPRAWGRDRLHLTPEAHRRVALRVLEALGEPMPTDWRTPWPAAQPTPWRRRQQEDLLWVREVVLPHLGSRLRRRQPAAARAPKQPELRPIGGETLPA